MLLLVAFTCVALCAVHACKSNGSTGEDEATTEQTAIPPLPAQVRNDLMRRCDYVDMIYYNAPISISQNDQTGVRSVVNFATPQPASPDPDCEPTGRISYIARGEIAAEADFYFTDSCRYLLFIENGEVVYGSTLSAGAVSFFDNIRRRIDAQE